ncbi:MAG: DNA polymerase Y family protein [Propionivibrio sp.]
MRPDLLWLALHLPALPLEAYAPRPSPSAVVDHGNGAGHVVLGDAAAEKAGVRPGTGIAATRSLLPAITLLARSPEREAAALHALACAAGRLTPRISLLPDALLLEIGSCLRLFGGVDRLVAAARADVEAQQFTVATAVAPTPLGAYWLAGCHQSARGQTATPHSSLVPLCLDRASLQRWLDHLPVNVLPEKVATALARFGLRRLADLRSLSSAALARRIGPEALHLLACAYGETPDPRPEFVFPEHFSQPLALPASVENAGALLFAARRLTAALAGWLTARQSGVREFVLHLAHRQTETRLDLPFAEPTADGARFERVLRERLERLELAAPVEALRLTATHVAPLTGRSRALFRDVANAQEGVGAVLERFTARFGSARVCHLELHADHRPECATRSIPLAGLPNDSTSNTPAAGSSSAPPRPLWLLDSPEALREVDGRPWRQGPLQLLTGPERIESGWWDGGESTVGNGAENKQEEAVGDIRRDYYIARALDDGWLWIFRDVRAPGGWFLHGYFS